MSTNDELYKKIKEYLPTNRSLYTDAKHRSLWSCKLTDDEIYCVNIYEIYEWLDAWSDKYFNRNHGIEDRDFMIDYNRKMTRVKLV